MIPLLTFMYSLYKFSETHQWGSYWCSILNQRLNKIFGKKKVGVNNLRHTNITEALGDHKASKKKAEKLMSDMGSSLNMVDTYYKE
jgi:hypothetical protein